MTAAPTLSSWAIISSLVSDTRQPWMALLRDPLGAEPILSQFAPQDW